MPTSPRRSLRVASLLCLLTLQACQTPAPTKPDHTGTTTSTPASAQVAEPTNALPRWRGLASSLKQALADRELNLHESEAHGSPLPAIDPALRIRLDSLVDDCVLAPGEAFVFDKIHGPETPFPDHQPLRDIAATRTVLARLALAEGNRARAFNLVSAGITQAHAAFAAQHGIMPLVHAVGVWSSALDGVHALASDPALSPAEARALLAAVQTDTALISTGLTQAMQGEFEFVYRVIVQRLPQTDSTDLLLSGISTLGMATPEPPAAGQPTLGRTNRVLLDVPATLAAYEADLTFYFTALSQSSRMPRGIYDRTTGKTLAAYREELGAFYTYATSDDPVTPALLEAARDRIEATENPCGKMLACFLTPPWEVIINSAMRREAMRSSLCGLLAWRIHGSPAAWSALTDILPEPPADPFSDGALRFETEPRPRVWSVYQNGTDDGGILVNDNSGQPDDLVWLP